MKGTEVIHMAPSAARVAGLMGDLFHQVKTSEHQEAYYLALQESTENSNSVYFITFMLEMIANTISTTPQVDPQVRSLLDIINGEMSRAEIQHALGLRDRKSFRERYLQPALQAGVIEMTIPDKPNSRLQKYRLSDK